MFGSKKNDQFAKGGHTLFDHALEVEGSVKFGGVLDVEGTVNGDIAAVDGLDALVRVREKGCVNGDVKSPKIIINGRVNGDVYATEHLELASKAIVNGNVHYKVIEMVKGAEVNGNLLHIANKADEKTGVAAEIGSATARDETTSRASASSTLKLSGAASSTSSSSSAAVSSASKA